MGKCAFPTFLAPRRHPRPVSEEALRRVVPLEHVPVPALELAHHSVVQPRGNHHAVLGGLGELRALGWGLEKKVNFDLIFSSKGWENQVGL